MRHATLSEPMLRYVLLFLCCLLTRVGACAVQLLADEGRQTVSSKILGEDRTVLVSLPASYRAGTGRYPVLYLTDAQWEFEHAATSARFLARNRVIPEVIVVGVTNPDRVRDFYDTKADFKVGKRVIPLPTSGNGDRFLDFIEKELIPWTEAKYRTAPIRILAGHSAGGYFAMHALRTKPSLFSAVIAASPWMSWDDSKELKLLLPVLRQPDAGVRALFLSSAVEWQEVKAPIEAIRRALNARKDHLLRWTIAAYQDENHETTSVKAYFDGLKSVFSDWTANRDPETFALKGSLDDLKAFYAKFGDRLGHPFLPPEDIVNEFGYQHLGAKDVDVAVAAFRYATELYPDSPNTWDSLADGLERAGKKQEAVECCRKAVALGEAAKSPSLKTYREHLARLTG